MNREQYLQELFGRLSNRLPRRELESTMHYYEEYFEEAGPAREAEVIAELGTPEELAGHILETRTKPKGSHGWAVGLAVGGFTLLMILGAAWMFRATPSWHGVVSTEEEIAYVDGGYSFGGSGSVYADLEPFTALEVEIPFGAVNIVSGDSYGISMDWGSSKYKIDYECSEGELHIWGKGDILSFGDMDASVVIRVPEGAALSRIDMDVDMGDCWLGGLTVEELTVEADAGEVSLSDVTVGSASLELDMGSLSMSQVEAAELEAVLSMGDLEGYDLRVTGSLTAKNAMGNIDLSGDLRGRIELTCNMGAISLFCSGSAADYGYDLKTSLGQVCVDGENMGGSARRKGGDDFIEAKNDMGGIEINFGA